MPRDGYMMTISTTARAYRGIAHGEDAKGVVDIEFPDVRSAVDWAAINLSSGGRFRDPVTDIRASCVLQFNLSDWDDPRVF